MNRRSLWKPITLLLCILGSLAAQHAQHALTVQPRSPVIDGSKNPELISDREAIQAFFVAVAEPWNAGPDQLRRRKAKLARIGLSDADSATFVSSPSSFHVELTELTEQARALDLEIEARRNPPCQHR